MRIAVIGSGYVGLVAAAGLAELGHKVICVDKDRERITALNQGKTPIFEDYLQELLDRHHGTNLRFSAELREAVRESLIVLIAVGTPIAVDGDADLSHVEAVTRDIACAVDGYKVIIEKSTVPVYTSAWMERAMVLNGCSREDFDVVSNPEFLREGSAVKDFLYPDRIVVGTNSELARQHLRELYGSLLDGSYAQRAGAVPRPDRAIIPPAYIETSPQSAELIKHACNAFLAMKISF